MNIDDYEIKLFDYDKSLSKSIYTFDTYHHKNGVTFLNNEIYFSTMAGIFKINTDGSSFKTIKKSCNSKIYSCPTISKDGRKLLWQRVDNRLISKTTIQTKVNIVEMNLDGSDEKIIVFN